MSQFYRSQMYRYCTRGHGYRRIIGRIWALTSTEECLQRIWRRNSITLHWFLHGYLWSSKKNIIKRHISISTNIVIICSLASPPSGHYTPWVGIPMYKTKFWRKLNACVELGLLFDTRTWKNCRISMPPVKKYCACTPLRP